MKIHHVFLLLNLTFCACAHAQIIAPPASCVGNSEQQARQSARLQILANEDQADRAGRPEEIDFKLVSPRDLRRRIEFGEIFAEGCLANAADFAAAAIIYQHGDTADHAFQTFLWSRRAVDLGDSKQKSMMLNGIDRYLVRIGKRQLFATQYFKLDADPCWCLEPIEKSVTDSLRVSQGGRTRKESLAILADFNQHRALCEKIKYCAHPLAPSPKGTVPGFW